MKKNPMGAILAAGLCLFSLLSVVLAVWFLIRAQEADQLRNELVRMNYTMNVVKAFANETLLYAQTNSAIDPILRQYGLRRVPATNAPAATNAFPTTR